MLVGHNIVKSYGSTTVLRNVSIAVEPGKITALLGPSGSGKTSLLRTLSLLDPPDTGSITLDEIEYSFPLDKGVHIKPPWPRLTIVFQQLFLWPHLTLRQNILLPLKKRKGTFDDTYLNTLIDLFDMKAFIDRYPNEASLGQRQRTALARALVLEPEYMLLDEITASLDVEQVSIILSELKTLRDRGIGILAVTHLIHFAHEAADNIIFMDNGEIVESGQREVLDNPKHERVQRFLSVIESAT